MLDDYILRNYCTTYNLVAKAEVIIHRFKKIKWKRETIKGNCYISKYAKANVRLQTTDCVLANPEKIKGERIKVLLDSSSQKTYRLNSTLLSIHNKTNFSNIINFDSNETQIDNI